MALAGASNLSTLLAHGSESNFSNSCRCADCLGDQRLQQHRPTDRDPRPVRLRRGDRRFLEAADAAQHRQAALWRLPGVHGDRPGHRRLSAADDGRGRRLRPELQRRVDRRAGGGRRFGGGGRDLHRPADRDLCAADWQRLHQEADDADPAGRRAVPAAVGLFRHPGDADRGQFGERHHQRIRAAPA